MSDTIISVEQLGKKYKIAHQVSRVRHTTLRDAITAKAQGLFRRSNAANGSEDPDQLSSHSKSEEFWALKDVSFEIKRGEVLGIIGRNGAGKSTLLKTLSRITEPTSGRVRLNGRVASLLEVGTGFHPELTGRENIFLNGAILGMNRVEIRRKFDEIVAFSGVERFLDTPVKRYSSGMYVRLAFAVAAHLEPEILIVDEVLAVGDVQFQQKCLGKMRDVSSKEGRTVLFVSHNMGAVRQLCNRGLVLLSGEVSFDGGVDESIAKYFNDNAMHSGLVWIRPQDSTSSGIYFQKISISICGRQPKLVLTADIIIRSESDLPPVFISVDICDQFVTPIMQALPTPSPFISGESGERRISMEIELPPLTPGRYSADFWIGPHFTILSDYVKSAVSFEIVESPSEGRSFPHSPDHGSIVPVSRCVTY